MGNRRDEDATVDRNLFHIGETEVNPVLRGCEADAVEVDIQFYNPDSRLRKMSLGRVRSQGYGSDKRPTGGRLVSSHTPIEHQ